jgi:4-amino-4-deoxy-L-arabinose transferase-like glycosyltransferase
VTGMIARAMGAGRLGQVTAALASLFAITFLVVDSFFSMNPFDELWWVLVTYVLVLTLRDDRPELWLLVGLLAGAGFLTKESMVFFGMALLIGLGLSPARRQLRTPYPWLGAGIALACALPYLYWNYRHGWPTVGFWMSYGGALVNAGPLAFLLQQIQTMNPWTLPLWALGLYYCFFTADGRVYRLFGWAYVVLFVLFMLAHAKPYFLAPAYPVLFAGGARWGEVVTAPGRRWLRPGYLFCLVSTGLLLLPLGVPLLPASQLARLYALASRDQALQVESHARQPLPQWFADRFGWEDMARAVGEVAGSLSPGERRAACILAGNYGEAAAL